MRDVAMGALVAVVVVTQVWAAAGGRARLARLAALTETAARRRAFWRSALRGTLLHGLPGVALLVLAASSGVEATAPARAWLGVEDGQFQGVDATAVGMPLVLGLAFGLAHQVYLLVGQHRRLDIGRTGRSSAWARLAPLQVRDRSEIPAVSAFCLSAGLWEEVLYRLGLPAALLALTHSPAVACVASAALFALGHAYQGVWGVLGTALFAFAMSLVLALTGIVVAVALHVVVDARFTLIAPLLARRLGRRPTYDPTH